MRSAAAPGHPQRLRKASRPAVCRCGPTPTIPTDARRARSYGAKGIGLCRTEHMFFEPERLPIVQRMILAETSEERTAALNELLPFQRS